jgi:DNA mismatch repair protein MutS
MAIAERGQEVVFLRQIIPGGADKSYGIHVARLAGLPEAVVQRAWTLLQELEGSTHDGRRMSDEIATSTTVYRPPSVVHSHAIADRPSEPPIEWTDALRQLYALDIANLTPVQALVALNELQQRLRRGAAP